MLSRIWTKAKALAASASGSMSSVMIDQRLDSLAEWQAWSAANAGLRDSRHLKRLTDTFRSQGITEPLTGTRFRVDASSITGNLREGIGVNGLNSRQRATLYALQRPLEQLGTYEARIYATEAITQLALLLRGRYPKFLGSEYADSDSRKAELYPVPCLDLTALALPDNAFHIVTTNEVLEHVPSIDAALREIHRVLKPGGLHIGTCPFRYNSEDSDLRTVVKNGELVYLKPKEIHGNPAAPGEGSLVFEIPGWDILARARAAGFSSAYMRFIQSARHGIACSVAGGIFVLVLEK